MMFKFNVNIPNFTKSENKLLHFSEQVAFALSLIISFMSIT